MKVEKQKYILEKQILEVPKYDENASYTFSRYVIRHSFDGKTLLYNTLIGEMISFLPDEEKNLREYFVRNHYMFSDERTELTTAVRLKAHYHNEFGITNGRNAVTIFTSTCCNARCFYCYENGSFQENMSIETAEKVFQYETAHVGDRLLYMTWYGGEPLVNVKVIDYICKRLKEAGIDYKSDMITNAYLFDEELTARAANLWNIQTVRVTLDGLNDTYSRIKNYRVNDSDPFSRVIHNIDSLIDNGIHVQIRLHIDDYNYDEIEQLVDFVCERYGMNPFVDSYIHLLYTNHESTDFVHSVDRRLQFIDKAFELEKRLISAGLLKTKLREQPMAYVCQADCDNVYAILPSGKVIKCRDFLGFDPVDDVDKNRLDMDLVAKWKERSEDECRLCPVYMECGRLKLCLERKYCDKAVFELKYRKIIRAMEGQCK